VLESDEHAERTSLCNRECRIAFGSLVFERGAPLLVCEQNRYLVVEAELRRPFIEIDKSLRALSE